MLITLHWINSALWNTHWTFYALQTYGILLYVWGIRSIVICLLQPGQLAAWWISTQIKRQNETVNEWTRKRPKEWHSLNGLFRMKIFLLHWNKKMAKEIRRMDKKYSSQTVALNVFLINFISSFVELQLFGSLFSAVNAKRNPTSLWLQILLLHYI